MKRFFILSSFLTLTSLISFGQSQFWVTLDDKRASEKARTDHSSRVIDTLDLPYPSVISDVVLSEFPISDIDKMYVLRGNIGGQEIFQVDADGNASFNNDSIYTLADLELDESIMYDEIYVYPTKEVYESWTRFENDCGVQRSMVEKMMAFKGVSRYDSLSNSLYYTAYMEYGFYYDLQGEIEINGYHIKIRVPERLSWDSPYRYYVDFPNVSESVRIDAKDVFSFDGKLMRIDSFDYCNTRVLISNLGQGDIEVSVSGNSVADMSEITSLDLNGEYKIIHVWGPWCMPCLRNFPSLLEVGALEQVELMGVAVSDERSEVLESKEYKSTDWQHLYYTFDGIDEQDDIVITSYPIYYLLDSDNKLILKTNRVEKLWEHIE